MSPAHITTATAFATTADHHPHQPPSTSLDPLPVSEPADGQGLGGLPEGAIEGHHLPFVPSDTTPDPYPDPDPQTAVRKLSYGANGGPPGTKVKYISKTTVQTSQPAPPSSSSGAAQSKLNKGLVYLKDPTPADRGGGHGGAVPSLARGEGRVTVREKPGQEIRMRKPNPAPTLLPANPAERRKLVIEKPDDHANEHGGFSRHIAS